MTYKWYCFILTLIVSLALVASGCASTPKPRIFAGQLTVAPNANPDHQGRASPVVIKIYQLKDVGAFSEADFFSLYDDGENVLGGDLISVEERELQPGVNYDYSASITPEASYIAVIAAFRDIEKAQWRVITELPDRGFFDFMRSRILQINVTDLNVSAAFN